MDVTITPIGNESNEMSQSASPSFASGWYEPLKSGLAIFGAVVIVLRLVKKVR
jgi:hypothetical protein